MAGIEDQTNERTNARFNRLTSTGGVSGWYSNVYAHTVAMLVWLWHVWLWHVWLWQRVAGASSRHFLDKDSIYYQ